MLWGLAGPLGPRDWYELFCLSHPAAPSLRPGLFLLGVGWGEKMAVGGASRIPPG